MGASLKVDSEILKIAKRIKAPQMEATKEKIGDYLIEAFRNKIKTGDASWAPLSPDWIKIKGHGRQWEHRGRLGRALDKQVNATDVRVGLLGGEIYSDIPLIAASLEYGTSTIEARPMLGPTFADEQGNIIRFVEEDLSAKLRKTEE